MYSNFYQKMKPGTVYLLYENNELTPLSKVIPKYRSKSKKGNKIITRLLICKRCFGRFEGKKIRSGMDKACQVSASNERISQKKKRIKKAEKIAKAKDEILVQRTCAECYWLRSTKCIDVSECLFNQHGVQRIVPKYFKQKKVWYNKAETV